MTWREYYEATKHSIESLRRGRHVLDWATMPDPFLHYEGVPVHDQPADPPAPEKPAFDVLQGTSSTRPAGDGPAFLSQLLFYSAAISASKRVPSTGYNWSAPTGQVARTCEGGLALFVFSCAAHNLIRLPTLIAQSQGMLREQCA